MRENPLKYKCGTVEHELKSRGYEHLSVLARGKNIVIYSEEMGEKVNRCRLTQLKGNHFMLGMADHKGRWEGTPFQGTADELVTMVIEKFPFVLSKW